MSVGVGDGHDRRFTCRRGGYSEIVTNEGGDIESLPTPFALSVNCPAV